MKGSPQSCSYLALFSSGAVTGGPVSRWSVPPPPLHFHPVSPLLPSGGPQRQKQRLSLGAHWEHLRASASKKVLPLPDAHSGHISTPGQQQSGSLIWETNTYVQGSLSLSLSLEFSLKCSLEALSVFTFFLLACISAFSAHQQPHKVPQEPAACMHLSQLPPDAYPHPHICCFLSTYYAPGTI